MKKKDLKCITYILFLITLWPKLLFCMIENDSLRDDSISYLWADSVLKSLNLEEKIAQLMMVRTYSNKDGNYYRQMDKLVEDYNVGGFCFFQGGPVAQAKLTNRYQKLAKTPLFIAMDAEWGLGMRLDSSFSFPFQMTIGATSDDEVVYQMGKEIARQLKLLGVHINFAPVIDVNNNPSNPVINSRSFGEYPEMVANHGIAYMKGLQDNGIIATAKHFPGHGDTDSDSHLTLPLINHSIQRLDSVELLPFKRLISQGLGAVMVAHLFIPAMDSTPDLPSTLSENIVNGWLKNKLGFEGLVISDALDMKGVTKYFKPGEIEIKAFKAGIDILLLPQDVSVAIKRIKEAVVQGEIQEEEITQRCKKILRAKEREKLNSLRPVDCDSVYIKIHNVANQVIERKLYKQAITVVKNNENILPLQRLDTLSIAVLSIGSAEISPFQRMLNNYSAIDFFNILDGFTENQENQLLQELSKQNLLIIGLHNTSIFPNRNFGISNKSLELIKKLSEKTRVILAMFSSPYSLGLIEGFDEIDAVILGYQDSRISQEVCAQIIMGAIGSRGILPVSAGTFRNLETTSLERLKYGIPEDLGIDSRLFDQIDSIALKAIADKAMPGCQILIAKDGNVIYQKSFGYHTYKKGRFVKNTDLYDLASITKIAASTLSIMNLVDEGKFDIDQKLKLYLPYLKGSNKEDLITRDLLSHQARLQAWIPFYLYTLKDSKPDPMIFRSKLSPEFTTKVAENLFIRTDYSYILYDTILNSELRKKKEYKYSDLGFYLLKQSIENITNKPLSSFVEDKFYNRLGLQFMGFNPIDKFNPSVIVPTENDQYFRFQLIHGYVHDPGAAMLGGVSGHAGLFSNANDLAILMQMLLQEGYYGGIQYLNSSTIKQFTKQQFPLNDNRRALGFDKPNMEDWEKGPTCKSASESSFGHSGFTGTYVWTDPEFGLTYIFLSNRIHPSAENTKLIKWNTRTEIQKIIYNAIGSFVK